MLASARARTLRLLEQVPDELLKLRVHDFYSPIGWHFGHIGMTEEFWVMTQALKRSCLDPDLAFLFANLPENPKDNRVHLPDKAEIRSYLAATREATLAALEATDLSSDDALIADGYAWDFAHQHECQHQETILELLQLLCKHRYAAKFLEIDLLRMPDAAPASEMAAIPGGAFLIGSDDQHGYDNEKRAHEATVAPFRMDVTPVTAGQWFQFIQEGGYQRRELWTSEGWAWREQEKAEHPEYWRYAGSERYFYFGGLELRGIHPHEPVSSISWYEADAFARWIGKRLPTEAEWEFAAGFDPKLGRSRRYPQGDAPSASRHQGELRWEPRAVGQELGRSALGLRDLGQVWEWTASPFLPYPGFVAFPYDGYSKEHMDGLHFVCRGGSWASDPRILRCSFRNWYVPTYRQGFLGLRCAV